VGPDSAELRLVTGQAHDLVDGLAGHRPAALGNKQPRQVVFPGGEVALDGSELIAGDRLLDRPPLKRATHRRKRLKSSWSLRLWIAAEMRSPGR
jgi:hypothetical protein